MSNNLKKLTQHSIDPQDSTDTKIKRRNILGRNYYPSEFNLIFFILSPIYGVESISETTIFLVKYINSKKIKI